MTYEQACKRFGNKFLFAKRFGITQGDKVRSIDDYSALGMNATVTTHDRLDLFSTDEVFVLMKEIARGIDNEGRIRIRLPSGEVLTGKLPPGVTPDQARSWLGKTFDLKSAYRQIHVAQTDTNVRLAIVAVFDPYLQRLSFRQQFASPFGSISSVYLFNRASRALWACGVWAGLIWTNYFDDFPTLDLDTTSTSADITARALFTLFGWSYATEEKKNRPFAASFPFLGIVADLSRLKDGKAIFANKEERVLEITSGLQAILSSGSCSPPEMASMRGRCQYAAAQIFGRIAQAPLDAMVRHQYSKGGPGISQELAEELRYMQELLTSCPPRELDCTGTDRPILIFTDGAVEGDKVTIGAVIIDVSSSPCQAVCFGGDVERRLVNKWTEVSGEQVIGQAEILPTLLSRVWLGSRVTLRRLLFFIDNNSARMSLARGRSMVPTSNKMIKFILRKEFEDRSLSWFSRVPTHSNPGDGPSRLKFNSDADLGFAIRVDLPPIPEELLGD